MEANDAHQKASFYHEMMNQAYEASQKAWNEGRKDEAKKYANERKEYTEKMKEYGKLAKELKEKQKQNNVFTVTSETENIVKAEFEKMQNINDYERMKKLNEEYYEKRKSNYDQARISWAMGLKDYAKKYSDLGAAYKICAHFSTESLKDLKEKDKINKNKLSEEEFRKLLSLKISEIKYEPDDWNEDLLDYRELAGLLSKQMANYYGLSQKAFKDGDKAKAKELAEKGDDYKEKMEEFNKKAAKTAFIKNNKEKNLDELDLHGLTVNEAQLILDEKIDQCSKNKDIEELKIIVGKGLHSSSEGPKLKEMVTNYAGFMGFKHYVDAKNEGCIFLILK